MVWTQQGIIVNGGHTVNEIAGIRLLKSPQFKESLFIDSIAANFIYVNVKSSDQLSFLACSNDGILNYNE